MLYLLNADLFWSDLVCYVCVGSSSFLSTPLIVIDFILPSGSSLEPFFVFACTLVSVTFVLYLLMLDC